VGGRFIIDMFDLLMVCTGLWNVPRNGLVRGTACRQALHQKRAPRDSPHLKVDTVVRRLHRQYVRHDPKTDGIQWSRLRDLCASTQSERKDRETSANQASPRVSFLAMSTVFGSYPANEYWLTVRWIPEFRV